MKHLHKFYGRPNIHWVNLIWSSYYLNEVPRIAQRCGSFWWKDVFQYDIIFRGIANPDLDSGKDILFWEDMWENGVLSSKWPRLFSYAKYKDSIAQHMARGPQDQFHLPLSHQAYEEYKYHAYIYEVSLSIWFQCRLAVHLGNRKLHFSALL